MRLLQQIGIIGQTKIQKKCKWYWNWEKNSSIEKYKSQTRIHKIIHKNRFNKIKKIYVRALGLWIFKNRSSSNLSSNLQPWTPRKRLRTQENVQNVSTATKSPALGQLTGLNSTQLSQNYKNRGRWWQCWLITKPWLIKRSHVNSSTNMLFPNKDIFPRCSKALAQPCWRSRGWNQVRKAQMLWKTHLFLHIFACLSIPLI